MSRTSHLRAVTPRSARRVPCSRTVDSHVELGLESSLKRGAADLGYRQVECPSCWGSGLLELDHAVCRNCEGSGHLWRHERLGTICDAKLGILLQNDAWQPGVGAGGQLALVPDQPPALVEHEPRPKQDQRLNAQLPVRRMPTLPALRTILAS